MRNIKRSEFLVISTSFAIFDRRDSYLHFLQTEGRTKRGRQKGGDSANVQDGGSDGQGQTDRQDNEMESKFTPVDGQTCTWTAGRQGVGKATWISELKGFSLIPEWVS